MHMKAGTKDASLTIEPAHCEDVIDIEVDER